jgi:glycosyltransferase involved in cell wall biosynthesis
MARILMAAYTNFRRDPRVRREAEALVEAGHAVVFLARRQPDEAVRETLSGVDVIKLPGFTHDRSSIVGYLLDYAVFFVLLALHLTLRPRRYRLIHINNMPDFLVFATWLPRLLGVPVIHDVHDLMPELYQEKFSSGRMQWLIGGLKLQERWAARFASAVLTVEDGLKDILSRRGVAARKIHVLMNLPDERIFAPRRGPRFKGADEPFVLVYHGTLARRLGLDVAIEALALARPSLGPVELRIIGAGEERERLIALRDALGLQREVSFSPGFVPVQDIPAMIADADVGIVPLRASGATDIMLPTKLLEYVQLGIPSIVPRTPTVARHFDEQMVEFFQADDAASLAQAIVRLHRDPGRRSLLSSNASSRFGQAHTWTQHKQVYLDLVDRLLRTAPEQELRPRNEGRSDAV